MLIQSLPSSSTFSKCVSPFFLPFYKLSVVLQAKVFSVVHLVMFPVLFLFAFGTGSPVTSLSCLKLSLKLPELKRPFVGKVEID